MGRKGGGKVKIIQKGGPGGGMGGGPNMMQGMMQNMPPPPRAVNPEIWVIPKDSVRDSSRWITIYPNYIDSKKTLELGRKIPKSSACESPTVTEISQVLGSLNLKHCIEGLKNYPRDHIKGDKSAGRVQVSLFEYPVGEEARPEENDDCIKTPYRADIATRKALMLMLAKEIPLLKSRTDPKPEEESSSAIEPAKSPAQGSPATKPTSNKSTSNKKKGNKKKGKK